MKALQDCPKSPYSEVNPQPEILLKINKFQDHRTFFTVRDLHLLDETPTSV